MLRALPFAFRALQALFLSCLCMLAMTAAVHAAVKPEQAELIMKKSGLWDQLGSVLPQARVGFSAAFSLAESEPAREESDALNEALEQAYGADTLRKLGLSLMSKSLEGTHVAAMQRWFDSPLGRKIDQVEQASAATQTDLRAVIRQGSGVFESLPAARRELLRQILKATRADEAMVDVSIHTLVATHRGISTAIPGSRLSSDEVKATLMSEREPMVKAYTQLILASFAQAYAPLSDQELSQYVDFLKSKAGRRHTQLAHRSLQVALDEGAARFLKLAPAALKTLYASQEAQLAASASASAPVPAAASAVAP